MKNYMITTLINGFYQYLILTGRSITEIKEKLNNEYSMLEVINIVLV